MPRTKKPLQIVLDPESLARVERLKYTVDGVNGNVSKLIQGLLKEKDEAVAATREELKAAITAKAKSDAKLFVEEFNEPLDSSATDWDSEAWGEARRELRLPRESWNWGWEIYSEALAAETSALCR
jgi:hypothetical protein